MISLLLRAAELPSRSDTATTKSRRLNVAVIAKADAITNKIATTKSKRDHVDVIAKADAATYESVRL